MQSDEQVIRALPGDERLIAGEFGHGAEGATFVPPAAKRPPPRGRRPSAFRAEGASPPPSEARRPPRAEGASPRRPKAERPPRREAPSPKRAVSARVPSL